MVQHFLLNLLVKPKALQKFRYAESFTWELVKISCTAHFFVWSFVLNLKIGTRVLCTSLFPFFWHIPWYRYLLMLFKCPEQPHSSSGYTNDHIRESFVCFLLCRPEKLLKIIWVMFCRVNAYHCHHHQFLVPFSSVFVWMLCCIIYLHYYVSPLL